MTNIEHCVNCEAPAKYEVQNPGAEDQLFCAEHLPWFINLSHDLGSRVMPVVQPVAEPLVSKSTAKRTSITKLAELAEVDIQIISEKETK